MYKENKDALKRVEMYALQGVLVFVSYHHNNLSTMIKHLRSIALVAVLLAVCGLKAQTTITLGYCPDTLSDNPFVLTMSDKGTYSLQAAIKIPGARLQYLKGASLKKIRIAAQAGISSTYVWVRPSIEEAGTLSIQRLGTTEDGWNEVELKKPYTITGEDIYVGYNGSLPANTGIYFDGENNSNAAYVGNGMTWNNVSNDVRGSLCIQAIVETTADTPTSDIAIEGCTFDKSFTRVGETVRATFSIGNYGINEAAMPRLFYSLNDGATVEVATSGIIEANESRTVEADIVAENTTEGYNNLHIWIDADDAFQDNNACDQQLCCYESSYERKVLLEHFTTLPCINCPAGHTVLSTLLKDRSDYVWVSHHVGFGEDELTVSDSYDISTPLGISSAPLAAFDRTIFDMSQSAVSPAFGIASTDVDYMVALLGYYFNQRAATPAFVSVNIENEYDVATRLLTTTVSGQRTQLLNLFYPSTCLTVQLVEDSVATEEAQKGSGDKLHNHVYRCSLTSAKGNEMEWNGDSYSYTYSLTLPEGWNKENLRVVAFVAQPIDNEPSQIEILNANQLPAGSTSGIAATSMGNDGEIISSEYYNLSGQKISKPSHGLYIEKIKTRSGSYTVKHAK